MKALHFIISLSIASNFSIYSMNIVSRKIVNLTLTLKAKSLSIKKVKEFFDMNDVNNLVSLSNIVIAGIHSYPLYLLPIIPQMLGRTSTYLRMQKSLTQNEHDFIKDFDYFSGNIVERLENIYQIDKEIKNFTEKQDIPQLKRLGLLTEHENMINKLETNKTSEELILLKETTSLFKIHDINLLSMQEYENYLNQQKIIKTVDDVSLAVNFISIPSMAFILACIDCTGLEALSLILSIGAMVKNIHFMDIDDQESSNLKHVIELLKIHQKHMKNKDNQNQINE